MEKKVINFGGLIACAGNDVAKVTLDDNITYNVFANDGTSRDQINKIKNGCILDCETKEIKGYPTITKILKVIETKELQNTDSSEPKIQQPLAIYRTPKQIVMNSILIALCDLYSNDKTKPTTDELCAEVGYIYKKLF